MTKEKIMINKQAPITKEKIRAKMIAEGFHLINCNLVIDHFSLRCFRLVNCNLAIGYYLCGGI